MHTLKVKVSSFNVKHQVMIPKYRVIPHITTNTTNAPFAPIPSRICCSGKDGECVSNITPAYEVNERMQYHVKNNIRIIQHQIQHIMMNTNANKADISELEDLFQALDTEKKKLKDLQQEGHDWYDEIYYREYE